MFVCLLKLLTGKIIWKWFQAGSCNFNSFTVTFHRKQNIGEISWLGTLFAATFYVYLYRELLGQHEDNLHMVLTHTIYNELSTTRNPNNMALTAVVFQTKPETAAQVSLEKLSFRYLDYSFNCNMKEIVSEHSCSSKLINMYHKVVHYHCSELVCVSQYKRNFITYKWLAEYRVDS